MEGRNKKVEEKGGRYFPTTHWSMLEVVRTNQAEGHDEALRWLTERYWRPVYSYIRRKGNNESDSQDLTQRFFLFWIEKNLFSKADPERGRFRNFLLTSLNNFLTNAHRDAHAACRFPEGGFVSGADDDSSYLDRLAADVDTPEDFFQRVWLAELIRRVMCTLHDECIATGKQVHFDIFKQRIIKPIIDGIGPPSQHSLAEKHGLSEKQVANYLLTARRSYQRLLKEEVRSYATSERDAAKEISELFEFISDR